MRKVLNPFPRSQHRPSLIIPTNPVEPIPTRAVKRWNFRQANWEQFTALVENGVNTPPLPTVQNVDAAYAAYCNLLTITAKQTIPRGIHQQYIPTWNEECDQHYNAFLQAEQKKLQMQRLWIY